MSFTVTIKRKNDEYSSISSYTSGCMQDSFYHAMNKDWGFALHMEVLIAEVIANNCFDSKGRELLREFLRHTGCKAARGVDSVQRLYEMALGPDDL